MLSEILSTTKDAQCWSKYTSESNHQYKQAISSVRVKICNTDEDALCIFSIVLMLWFTYDMTH